MACLYCGKEVPFRMRLTGEEHFCCPAHKRLYHDEHSRLGLARLLEEVAPSSKVEATEQRKQTLEPTLPDAPETATETALPEPERVASGQGLRLWTYPHLQYPLEARFARFSELPALPVAYCPGSAPADAKSAVGADPEGPELPGEGAVERAVTGECFAEGGDGEGPTEITVPSVPGIVPGSDKPADGTAADVRESEPAAAPPSIESAPAADPVEPIFAYGVSAGKQGGGQAAKFAAAIILVLGLGAAGYWGLGITGNSEADKLTSQLGTDVRDWGAWIPGWSDGDQGEEIALFGPSQEWTDYRVEWRAEAGGGLAWVFRAVDPENYYAVRLEEDQAGGFEVVRYAMIQGTKQDVGRAPLDAVVGDSERYAVELEIKGAQFTLYVNGYNVAEWSDDRLPRGGFGVMRPDSGLAGVSDVKVTQLERKSAGRRGYWKGAVPESLPEVSLITSASGGQDSRDSTRESTL